MRLPARLDRGGPGRLAETRIGVFRRQAARGDTGDAPAAPPGRVAARTAPTTAWTANGRSEPCGASRVDRYAETAPPSRHGDVGLQEGRGHRGRYQPG